MTSISVVIPTLNEEHYVGALLEDLQQQDYTVHEVIVVDGDSIDGTVKLVKGFTFVRLISSQRSVSIQRNLGAAHSSGDLILFLDADTRISKNFIQNMISDFEKHSLDIACPLFVPLKAQLLTRFIFWYCNFIFILLQAVLPSGAGPCIMVKREVFQNEGGFKEDQAFEDMELIRRIGRKYRYGILFHQIYVSDRRFRTYGMFKMIALYVILSFLFTLGLFTFANRVKYTFGHYTNSSK